MQQPAAQNVQHAGQPASSKGTKAGTGSPTRISQKDADAEDDEDVPACPDDEVEVDAETEMLFEKVAAMEREKAAAALQVRCCDKVLHCSACPCLLCQSGSADLVFACSAPEHHVVHIPHALLSCA